jgi:multicomponent Na+:H+ antiporter subunit D
VAQAAPGLEFAFKLEPLGALFAIVASGLWIVNSFYSIGYMRGNRERNQTRFYICFAIAIFGAMGVAMSANLFTLFVFYEVLTLSTYPLVAHKGDAAATAGWAHLPADPAWHLDRLPAAGRDVDLGLAGQNLDFVQGGLLADVDMSPAVPARC